MTNSPNKQAAFGALLEIVRAGPAVIVGTGASMALDGRFGMPALTDHLRRTLAVARLSEDERDCWREIEGRLDDHRGLEAAIDATELNVALERRIVTETGRFVARLDREYKARIICDDIELPLAGLLGNLAKSAPPLHPVVPVITTNYDCLIEHTCDRLDIAYTSGFVGGLRLGFDWAKAIASMSRPAPARASCEVRKSNWTSACRYPDRHSKSAMLSPILRRRHLSRLAA